MGRTPGVGQARRGRLRSRAGSVVRLSDHEEQWTDARLLIPTPRRVFPVAIFFGVRGPWRRRRNSNRRMPPFALNVAECLTPRVIGFTLGLRVPREWF